MRWFDLLGYLGSVLMFSTFYMKTMIPLRVVGICANVCMIGYTAVAHVYPVLVLQSCLLPLNVVRLVQMRALIARVTSASKGDFKVDALIPFMTRKAFERGEVLFREGDPSDSLYFIQKGSVRLLGIDKIVGVGEVVGEIGLLSPDGERMATAMCVEDCLTFTISRDRVLQLYYQNPEFGFFLIRLVTRRLLHNLEAANFEMAQTLSPGPERPPTAA
jgi:hypothetical protein